MVALGNLDPPAGALSACPFITDIIMSGTPAAFGEGSFAPLTHWTRGREIKVPRVHACSKYRRVYEQNRVTAVEP